MLRISWLIVAFIAIAACRKKVAAVSIPAGAVAVDVKVNGSDGPITADGSDLRVSWAPQNAGSCRMTSPANLSIGTSARSIRIPSSYAWYPKKGKTAVLRVACLSPNKTATAEDSVIIRRPQ